MMDKTFDPAAVEARIAARWEEAEAFRAGRPERRGAEPYTIVIPPPNVTGSLHMGHALNNTLQDILCRFERMRGRDVLWQPGMDHAGIATQMVVERQLMERSRPDRRDARPRGVRRRVWAWKEESGGTIISQLKRLGASCDWSRERFTMDEGLSRAVLKVFVDLYSAGPDLQRQAAGELGPEVPDRDLGPRGGAGRGQGPPLAHPLPDRGRARPLHHRRDDPARDDARRHRASRCIPTTSATATSSASTRSCRSSAGASRSSPTSTPIPRRAPARSRSRPAHDFNDFEVGRRHELPLDQHPRAGGAASARRQRGLPRRASPERPRRRSWPSTASTASRRASASSRCSRSGGFLEKVEPHTHTVPHGDRSGAVIEPYLTDQWYVNVKPLAERALAAVRDGRDAVRARDLGEDLLPVAREHRALVRLAPALVGPPDPGLVRRRRQHLRRAERRGAEALARRASKHGRDVAAAAATRTCSTPGSPPRSGRSRPWAGRTRRPSSRATTRPTRSSPASTSSSSGSPG